MTDDFKKNAAHHEAGHVIVARHRGITPNYVEIKYNATCQRWEGANELPELTGPTEEKLVSQFAICFAGCFEQVKHAIRMLSPTDPIPWKELLSWTLYQSEQPLDLSLSCVKTLHVPSWWFEGGDKQSFAYLADKTIDVLGRDNFTALLQRAVRHTTIPVLDDVQSWSKVTSLASLLIGSASEGVDRVNAIDFPL